MTSTSFTQEMMMVKKQKMKLIVWGFKPRYPYLYMLHVRNYYYTRRLTNPIV